MVYVRVTIRTEKAREAGSEQQPEKAVGIVLAMRGFSLALRCGFGFFLQDFGPGMNLSRAVSGPSLRPVIAKNGDTDVQVRFHVGAPTP